MSKTTRNQYRNVFLSTVSGCVRLLANIAILVFLTPYIISKVGVDAFGLWSLVLSIVGFFDLLDLGFGNTVIKYVAESKALEDHVRGNQIISTLLAAYCLLSFLGIFVFFIVMTLFNQVFAIPEQEALLSIYLLGIMGVRSLFVMLPFSVFRNVLFAEQHIFIINILKLLSVILYACLAWTALSFGMGLLALAILNLLVSILEYAAYGVLAFLYDKKLHFSFSKIEFKTFKQVLPFSTAQFFSNISSLILFNSALVIIKIFLPLKYVGLYAIPLRVSAYGYMLLNQFSNILTPLIVNKHSLKQHEGLRHLFIRGTQYVLTPATILTVGGILSAKELLVLWVGKEFEAVSFVLIILLLAMWLTTVYTLAGDILQLTGYHNTMLTYAWIMLTVNVVTSIILIQLYGLNGMALGTLCASCLGFFLEFRRASQVCNIHPKDYFGAILPFAIIPALVQGSLLLLLKKIFLVTKLWVLVLLNIFPAICYLIVAWLMLGKQERNWIKEMIGYK